MLCSDNLEEKRHETNRKQSSEMSFTYRSIAIFVRTHEVSLGGVCTRCLCPNNYRYILHQGEARPVRLPLVCSGGTRSAAKNANGERR